MVVAGLSLSTRAVAIVIMKNRKLIHWQTSTFHQKWSKAKLKLIILTIAQKLEEHDIEHIAIKTPDRLSLSKNYTQLIGSINIMCEQIEIKPTYYKLSDLKHTICKQTCSKELLIKEVLKLFPDLHCVNQKSGSYHNRIFEALAAAYCKQNEH